MKRVVDIISGCIFLLLLMEWIGNQYLYKNYNFNENKVTVIQSDTFLPFYKRPDTSLKNIKYGMPKAGTAIKWINRIELPDYAKDFYKALVEASDGDGNNDFLIDITLGNSFPNNTYWVPITQKTGCFQTKRELDSKYQADVDEVTLCMEAVFGAFCRDYPEVFWLKGSFSIGCINNVREFDYETVYYLWLRQSDGEDIRNTEIYPTTEAIYSAIKQRDNWVEIIVKDIPIEIQTHAQIISYFNKWLVDHNQYNTAIKNSVANNLSPLIWECVSALKGSSGTDGPTCEGYAKAFQVLCNYIGIPCVLVNNNMHMWNYVQLDEVWYGVDVTWNDDRLCDDQNKFLLVGANTVINGERFIDSHPVENKMWDNFPITYQNGPVLSITEYASPISENCSDLPGEKQ